jgi:hypothetical protein
MTCIYCTSSGPFTDEHVISTGIGGDDLTWLLKDCVCGACNTGVFSKLETKVLKSSPIALARLFLQSRTRDKTAAPSIQPKASYFEDHRSKLLLEQDLGAGGAVTVLPQVLLVPPNVLAVAGPDLAEISSFMASCQALPDRLLIVEKVRDGFEVRFDNLEVAWRDDAYVEVGRTSGAKPPKSDIVWFETAIRPATAPADYLLPPRLFKRQGGQIVCRAHDVAHVGTILGIIRSNASIPADTVPTGTNATPDVHLHLVVDLEAHDRFLAKTGINLCAHLLGADVVRDPAFDRVRDYARTGAGKIYMVPPDQITAITNSFGPPPPGHHVLILMPSEGKHDPTRCIVLLARLYGGPINAVRLAEFAGAVPKLSEPIVVVVNYDKHQIRRMSLQEYAIFLAGLDDV